VLLKVLSQPPRPIGGLHAQIRGNCQRWANNEMKARGILKGPIPYGIIWWLVFLKVLPQPPRPIGGLLAQIWGNHQGMGNNEIKSKEDSEGSNFYLPAAPAEFTAFGPELWIAFYLLFRGNFWRPSSIQIGHTWYYYRA
jgi:hypothetical protein